jgi:hypothetical protein
MAFCLANECITSFQTGASAVLDRQWMPGAQMLTVDISQLGNGAVQV